MFSIFGHFWYVGMLVLFICILKLLLTDTTTTSTTTTTDRYRNFMEDSKNVAWISASVALAAVTLGVLVYVLYSCQGDKGCTKFWRSRLE